MGFNDFYEKWKHFVHHNGNTESTRYCTNFTCGNDAVNCRPWYLISVDIQTCFDSILSDHLLFLVKQLLVHVSIISTVSDINAETG